MAAVYISIGSNIDRENNIRLAVSELRTQFGDLLLSSVYESGAFGFDGDPFYNLVARFETDASQDAQQIISQLHDIEARHGRKRADKKFSSRTLDLDLLLFGDADLRSQGLDVPRDEITRYAFVLGPLAEIEPEGIHPLCGQSYRQLWTRFVTEHPDDASAMSTTTFRW